MRNGKAEGFVCLMEYSMVWYANEEGNKKGDQGNCDDDGFAWEGKCRDRSRETIMYSG